LSYQVSRLISSGEGILNWSIDRKKGKIVILGYAIKEFAASLCQQTGGQFCHGIGCNICPKRPDKAKVGKAGETEPDDDDKDEESNLFTPPEDDKEAKAEKKRLYDEAMERVKTLAQNTKYAEALANLPDVAEYPDKAEAIESKRKTLQAGKEAYDKLTASFND
jgi:hypothetical protein